MSTEKETGKLPERILKAMKKIEANIPSVAYGGSISLRALNLLNREVNDIDIFLPKTFDIQNNEFIQERIIQERDGSYISEEQPDSNWACKISIDDVDVDIFIVDFTELDLLDSFFANHLGVSENAKLLQPHEAIKAKMYYALCGVQKHFDDIDFLLTKDTGEHIIQQIQKRIFEKGRDFFSSNAILLPSFVRNDLFPVRFYFKEEKEENPSYQSIKELNQIEMDMIKFIKKYCFEIRTIYKFLIKKYEMEEK